MSRRRRERVSTLLPSAGSSATLAANHQSYSAPQSWAAMARIYTRQPSFLLSFRPRPMTSSPSPSSRNHIISVEGFWGEFGKWMGGIAVRRRPKVKISEISIVRTLRDFVFANTRTHATSIIYIHRHRNALYRPLIGLYLINPRDRSC